MQAEQLQGGVHYHRLNIGGVHCRTLAHISSAYSIVSCRFCPLNKDGVSLPQLKTRRNAAEHLSYWKKGVCLISKQPQAHEVKHTSFQEEGNHLEPHI